MQQYVYKKKCVTQIAKLKFFVCKNHTENKNNRQYIFGNPIGAVGSIYKCNHPANKKNSQINFK